MKARLDKLSVAEVHPDRLRDVPDEELLSVHLRLHQLFAQHFAGNDKLGLDGLRREDLVNAELFVQAELARRGMKHEADDELAREAARLRTAKREQSVRSAVAKRKSTAFLLLEAGPPDEWSGGVAAALGADGRERVKALWETLSAEEQAEVRAAWEASYDAQSVADALEDRHGALAKAALPTTGVIISPRWMAEKILAGIKTLVVKTREMGVRPDQDVLLLSEREALGVVRFPKRRVVETRTELLNLKRKTLIDEDTLDKWCKAQPSWCSGPWVVYDVEVVQRFDAPRETNVPVGPQVLAHDVVVKSNSDGVMAALMLSRHAAEKLALEGGEPVETLHLTLAFLGDRDEMPEDFQSRVEHAMSFVAAETPTIVGTVSGIGRFVGKEGDVVYASFDAPALPKFRERVVEELKRAGVPVRGDHGFTPHITLAYIDAGAPTPELRAPQLKLAFSSFALVVGDADRVAFELSGIAKQYAPINPGGERANAKDPVTLEEVLGCYAQPIALRAPAVYLVGSLCNQGKSENDVDVLVRGPFDEATRRVIEFRLGRALPPRISRRLQFHGDELGGPFTRHVALYDLVLVPRSDRAVVEMRLAKQDDPLLDLPSKGSGSRPAVLQYHFRGRSLHLDMRLQVADYLVGWTLANQRAGAVPGVDSVAEAERIARTFSADGDRYAKPFRAPAKLFASPKSRQPVKWLGVRGEVFGEGEVGATRNEPGVIVAVDEPRVEFGLQQPFFHEYFFSKGKELVGAFYFRTIEGRERGEEDGEERPFWTAWLSKELLPSVLKPDRVKERVMPPDGYSAIPQSLERAVPKELRFWEARGEKARELRDALVAERIIAPAALRIVDGEIRLTTEKRYLAAPATRTYSAPSTLADAVADLLPVGRRYVNPMLTGDWRAAVKASSNDAAAVLVLSPSAELAPAELHELAEAVRSAKADWLVECGDNPEARDALMVVGRPFKLAQDPTRVLCASFPVRSPSVEWVDTPDDVWKQPRTVDFTLSWQWWKGQTVVRAAPSRQLWHLLLDEPRGGLRGWELARDPLSEEGAITALRRDRSSKELLAFEGPVEPGTKVGGDVLNPTKATPSQVDIVDRGKATILDDQAGFVRLQLAGERLRGSFHLVAEEVGSRVWQFGAGSEPGRAIPTAKAHTTETLELADGTKLADVQVWDPAKIKDGDDKGGEREQLRPLALFKPMKAAGRAASEFRTIDAALVEYGKPEALADGVVLEPKWNGFRVVLEKDADGRVLLFTEEVFDRRTKLQHFLGNMPGLAAEAEALPGPYVLDAEFLAERDGVVVPRRELAEYRGAGEVDDADVRLRVFRALYLPGKGNLTAQHEGDNGEALKAWLKESRRIKLTPRRLARTEAQLRDAIRWAAAVPGSEGAMLKRASSTYSLGGENDLWAKLKLQRGVRALVYRRDPVKGSPGVWTFFCAVRPSGGRERYKEVVEVGGKPYVPIGKTFNSSVDADVGDVLRVNATELLFDDKVGTVHWFTPTVVDKTSEAPMSVADVRELAQPGEVKKAWDRNIPILKTAEERYVLGVVLEPNDGKNGVPLDPDAQRDIYSAEEVRDAAHRFMEHHRNLGLMHREFVTGKVRILESYLAPVDFELAGARLRKGTWLLALRIVDDELWRKIKQGDFTGFSIGGSAIRRPVSGT